MNEATLVCPGIGKEMTEFRDSLIASAFGQSIIYSVLHEGFGDWATPAPECGTFSCAALSSNSAFPFDNQHRFISGFENAPIVDFFAVDADRSRRIDAQTHLVALHGNHGQHDITSDYKLFTTVP